jgi:cob(I)alamin adenosyltransferase
MAKIYTRVGDGGETALFAGGHVRKDHIRVETLGTVDELNAAIGVVRMELLRSEIQPGFDELLSGIQHRLFDLGAELATPDPKSHGTARIGDEHVAELETQIDQYDARLEPLRAFILPGGVAVAAQLHLGRCICRRAERRLVELAAVEPIRGELLRYVNRLSDLLFVLARAANQTSGEPDVVWQQDLGSEERGAKSEKS